MSTHFSEVCFPEVRHFSGYMKRYDVMEEKSANGGADTVALKSSTFFYLSSHYRLTLGSIFFCLLIIHWLSAPLLKNWPLLGCSKFSGLYVLFVGCSTLASTQEPPASVYFYKCCISTAGDRKGGEPESFTKTLWHSALEVISAGGCPGQSALTLDLPFPLPSRNHCTGYLQSETLCSSEPRILSWKADGGLQYPGLTLGGTIFFTLQRKNLNHKWNLN